VEDRTIHTDRLVMRPLVDGDAEALYRTYSHPQATRFWCAPHVTVDDTRALIASELRGPGISWTVCLGGEHGSNEPSEPIGVVSYLGNVGVPGLGYIMHPDYWGHGYMAEAVRAALAYGFSNLGIDRVELWIAGDNLRSLRLAERLGFTYRGRFRQKYYHDPASHEKRVYGLHINEWRTGPDAKPEPIPPCYGLEPVLAVRNVGATAEWYRNQLDFVIYWLVDDPPTHGSVALCQWTPEGARIQLTQASEAINLPTGLSLYLFVGPDIDERYARCLARGVEIVRALDSFPWGMREFSVRDPNGYVLRFGTPA
jgi:RimJ/RimL family protein N-acetyltransferase/uncharacterized glyoxalase superfamily protein PhnB